MKRWIAMILVVAMSLSLVACGGTTTQKESEESSVVNSSEKSEVSEDAEETGPNYAEILPDILTLLMKMIRS